jgi:hypothetical protein
MRALMGNGVVVHSTKKPTKRDKVMKLPKTLQPLHPTACARGWRSVFTAGRRGGFGKKSLFELVGGYVCSVAGAVLNFQFCNSLTTGPFNEK